MSEVLLCNRPLDPQQFSSRCGIDISQLTTCGCAKPSFIAPNTPYLVGADSSNASILHMLSPAPVARGLTDLSLSFGGDTLLPLAHMRDKLQEAGVGFLGESAGVTNHRGSAFVKAVKEYQTALLEYRKAIPANAPAKAAARQAAERAFNNLQRQFHAELTTVTAQIKARRGIPLTDFQRGINIATSGRDITKLHVANQVEASNLVKLTRHTKLLGNGLAVIDFGARVGNIHNEYKAGGDWHREMFIESSSFAVGASAGMIAAKVGGAALMLLIAATPVGWVGLVVVVGGLAVAGGAAAVSIAASNTVKEGAGARYDTLMGALNKP